MGVFEMAKFEAGTKGVMDAVVAATKAGAVSIIGVNFKLINIMQQQIKNIQ